MPRGSVLGPFLFLIYINDLPEVISSQSLLYADDLKVWNCHDPSVLQMDLEAIKRWSEDWSLPINDSKCAHMSLGGDSGNAFSIYSAQGQVEIIKVPFKKDLGIYLSSSLSFSLHHENAAKKGFAVLHMIRRTFPRITARDFEILYGVYVRPVLEYANQVVHTGYKKDANAIERVQRAATKMVHGLRNASYETRLQALDLYPLEYRRLRGDLIFTFSLFREGTTDQFFVTAPQDGRRGHDKKLVKTRPRTFLRQNFFSVRVVNFWNELPQPVVGAISKVEFKRLLDKHLHLNQNFITVTSESSATPFFF